MSIQTTLKKNPTNLDFKTELSTHGENETKVLVLYTGGTIGMVRNDEGALSPEAHAFEKKIRMNCTMHDETYSQKWENLIMWLVLFYYFYIIFRRFAHLLKAGKNVPLVMPKIKDLRRVVYSIYEYDPLLDSSNMTMVWIM